MGKILKTLKETIPTIKLSKLKVTPSEILAYIGLIIGLSIVAGGALFGVFLDRVTGIFGVGIIPLLPSAIAGTYLIVWFFNASQKLDEEEMK